MTTVEIKEKLIKLIYGVFKDMGFDADIIEYVDLVDDIGMESITFISILVELESVFAITVPDEMMLMDNFRKIDNIVAIIKQEQMKCLADKEND